MLPPSGLVVRRSTATDARPGPRSERVCRVVYSSGLWRLGVALLSLEHGAVEIVARHSSLDEVILSSSLYGADSRDSSSSAVTTTIVASELTPRRSSSPSSPLASGRVRSKRTRATR
jgi:hypothetical protein